MKELCVPISIQLSHTPNQRPPMHAQPAIPVVPATRVPGQPGNHILVQLPDGRHQLVALPPTEQLLGAGGAIPVVPIGGVVTMQSTGEVLALGQGAQQPGAPQQQPALAPKQCGAHQPLMSAGPQATHKPPGQGDCSDIFLNPYVRRRKIGQI